MPTRYRIEVFTRGYVFRDWAVIEDPEISYDYLTLDPTELHAPKLVKAQRGDYLCISNGYQGIITGVEYGRTTTTLTVKPLLSLLDVSVYYDRNNIYSMNLEAFLGALITATYIDNPDPDQNIPGMTVNIQTGTTDGRLSLVDNIQNIYTCTTKALTKYSVVVDLLLDPQRRTLSANIRKILKPARTIESDLPNILDRSFTLRDSYGAVNKFVAVNKRDETQQQAFYASGYAPPPVWTTEYIDDDDFGTAAANRAADVFTPQEFNNLIELTVTTGDRLVHDYGVGDAVQIIKDGVAYPSVMTGYTLKGNVVKLIFGAVRIDLTKILMIERRSR